MHNNNPETSHPQPIPITYDTHTYNPQTNTPTSIRLQYPFSTQSLHPHYSIHNNDTRNILRASKTALNENSYKFTPEGIRYPVINFHEWIYNVFNTPHNVIIAIFEGNLNVEIFNIVSQNFNRNIYPRGPPLVQAIPFIAQWYNNPTIRNYYSNDSLILQNYPNGISIEDMFNRYSDTHENIIILQNLPNNGGNKRKKSKRRNIKKKKKTIRKK